MSTKELDVLFQNLNSSNDKIRYPSFLEVIKLTDKKVNWIYQRLPQLHDKISSDNSYQRNIGLILIANLAKSDTKNKIIPLLDEYLAHFDDEKFITSRLCIQNVWKIASAKKITVLRIVAALEKSYNDNIHLKTHGNLIKQDIIQSLVNTYNSGKDENIKRIISSLAEGEMDQKIKKIFEKITRNIL